MKWHWKTYVSAAALFFTACGENKSAGEPVADEKMIRLDEKKSYEGKRVSFEGYFKVPDNDIWSGRGSNEETISLSDKPCTDKQDANSIVAFSIHLSSLSNNALEVPSSFNESNVFIRTNDGERLRCRDKIKVSGTVEYVKNMNPIELMDVQMDKKGNVTSKTVKSHAYNLKDIRIDKAD